MRLMTLLMLFVTVAMYGQKPTPTPAPAPTLTAEQREQIRKFQLDDQRMESAIRQRQLEINQLQQQAQVNARKFEEFTAGLCKDAEGKYKFDMSSDELRCVAKPTPAPNPKPTEKK